MLTYTTTTFKTGALRLVTYVHKQLLKPINGLYNISH